jgi:hypothetical protein
MRHTAQASTGIGVRSSVAWREVNRERWRLFESLQLCSAAVHWGIADAPTCLASAFAEIFAVGLHGREARDLRGATDRTKRTLQAIKPMEATKEGRAARRKKG